MDVSTGVEKNQKRARKGEFMRNKDVKQLIRKAAFSDMPDVRNRIDLNVIPEYVDKPIKRSHNPFFSFNQVLKFASVLLLFGLTSLFVYQQLTNPIVEVMAMETEAELIGFPAISGSSLLIESEVSDLSYREAIPLVETTSPEIESYLTQLNPYINAMESMIGDKTSLQYSLESNGNDYQYQITYVSSDLLENEVTYVLYYNKTKLADVADAYQLDGVMVIGDRELTLTGRLIQTKTVTKTRWEISTSEDEVLVVDDVTTDRVQQFRYQRFEGDVLQETASLTLKLENNDVSGELSFEDNDTTVTYQMSRYKKNTANAIQIAYALRKGSLIEEGELSVSATEDESGISEYHIVITPRGSQASTTIVNTRRKSKNANDSTPGNDDSPGRSDNRSTGKNSFFLV